MTFPVVSSLGICETPERTAPDCSNPYPLVIHSGLVATCRFRFFVYGALTGHKKAPSVHYCTPWTRRGGFNVFVEDSP